MRLAIIIVTSIVSGIFVFSCELTAEKPVLQADIPQKSPTPESTMNREPCLVDFRNFTYPPAFESEKKFTLTNGRFEPTRNLKGMVDGIGYVFGSEYVGNVYGNESKEHIIIIGMITGGSAIPTVSYIFEMNGTKPRFLWKYVSGDRADGGLRNIYGQDNKLIIEAFEPSPSTGDCCPKTYAKIEHKWSKNKFVEVKRERNLPNSSGSANFVGQDVSCK